VKHFVHQTVHDPLRVAVEVSGIDVDHHIAVGHKASEIDFRCQVDHFGEASGIGRQEGSEVWDPFGSEFFFVAHDLLRHHKTFVRFPFRKGHPGDAGDFPLPIFHRDLQIVVFVDPLDQFVRFVGRPESLEVFDNHFRVEIYLLQRRIVEAHRYLLLRRLRRSKVEG